jgi:hypothetical protein
LPTIVLLTIVPLLGACSNMRHYEWTEDAKLSDGTRFLVRRSEDYKRVLDLGAGFQEGWLFQKSTLAADLPMPVGRTVSWEGSLKPLVLDIQPDKTIYLVNVVATGASRHEWHVPDHEFYVVFKLTENGWKRISLSELPVGIQPNLLGNTYTLFIHRDARSGIHVDLRMKAELQSDGLLAERYKWIVRLPPPAK